MAPSPVSGRDARTSLSLPKGRGRPARFGHFQTEPGSSGKFAGSKLIAARGQARIPIASPSGRAGKEKRYRTAFLSGLVLAPKYRVDFFERFGAEVVHAESLSAVLQPDDGGINHLPREKLLARAGDGQEI